MKRFILLQDHDDRSLTEYLQHCAESGQLICGCRGNLFSFRKQAYSGGRVAAVTLLCDDPNLKMKFQVEDYAAFMKKKGWRLLCCGTPEDIFDSRRHVFLQTDDPEAVLPETDPELAEKAAARRQRRILGCITALLLLLGFGIFFFSREFDVVLSSTPLLLCAAAAAPAGLASAVFCAERLIRKGFRSGDRAVLCCMLAFAALALGFASDSLMTRSQKSTIVVGNERVTLYRDTLPVSMADLGVPLTGRYHSSAFSERKSPLLAYSHASDQSFNLPLTEADLNRLSYTVYRVGTPGLIRPLLRWKLGTYEPDADLAGKWQADEACRLSANGGMLRFGSDILIWSASFPPDDGQVRKLLEGTGFTSDLP